MDVLQQQVAAVIEEVGTFRAEIIQMKTAHASLHQSSVERDTQMIQRMTETTDRLGNVEKRLNDTLGGLASGSAPLTGKPKDLIEAKQVEVACFAGSVVDSRVKFMAWAEKMSDRIMLFNPKLVDAMNKVSQAEDPVSPERSAELGITDYDNRQLQGFLKDRTEGTANSIIRSNRTELGLESWRMISRQFNPRTIQSTLDAEYNERNPRAATKISDLPNRLLEWEKNLRRCIAEGREVPSDATKRLALLRMLPKEERKTIQNYYCCYL